MATTTHAKVCVASLFASPAIHGRLTGSNRSARHGIEYW